MATNTEPLQFAMDIDEGQAIQLIEYLSQDPDASEEARFSFDVLFEDLRKKRPDMFFVARVKRMSAMTGNERLFLSCLWGDQEMAWPGIGRVYRCWAPLTSEQGEARA